MFLHTWVLTFIYSAAAQYCSPLLSTAKLSDIIQQTAFTIALGQGAWTSCFGSAQKRSDVGPMADVANAQLQPDDVATLEKIKSDGTYDDLKKKMVALLREDVGHAACCNPCTSDELSTWVHFMH